MQELFLNSEASVQSDRILYTPSLFARSALLNLQEVGSLKARSPHTSTRSGLTSYLYFLVLDGEGSLTYEGRQYKLNRETVSLLIVKNHTATVHQKIYGHLHGAIFMEQV